MPNKQKLCPDIRLIAITLAALTVIALGALFLIAPVVEFGYKPADYQPVTQETTATPQIVDINTADAEVLQTLPGIGPAKAAAIIVYREENGRFSSLQEVAKVPGISEKMVNSWANLAVAGAN